MSDFCKVKIGDKYGRLTIIVDDFLFICGARTVIARCDCGKEKRYRLSRIRKGRTLSCGCLRKELMSKLKSTHRLTSHPLYGIRINIIRRCINPTFIGYENYGGRGIIVCDEWLNNFESFYNWAISNGWQKGLQIDRINNDGNYEPDNCRFVTSKQNSRNRRNNWVIEYKGDKKLLIEWCEDFNRNFHKVRNRMYAGWNFEKAMDFI